MCPGMNFRSCHPSFDLTYEGLKSCIQFILSKWFVRFDLTYEGLKSGMCRKIDYNMHCFDLTYEGLKRPSIMLSNHASTSFDLTYEGLKLIIGTFLQKNRLVLILPMRD